MKIVACSEGHADRILAILNEAIVNTTALYDYRPRTPEMMAAWFDSKRKGNYPIIGAASDAGELLGFGTYGPFRPFPAYKYTVEHSLYIAAEHRGKGVGRRLLQELIARAREQEYHVLIGAIDSANAASIALHKRMAFEHAGTVRQAGFKFGRWLDLELHQLILDTPKEPVDG
jgi:phosphinothricin acetyltransferase